MSATVTLALLTALITAGGASGSSGVSRAGGNATGRVAAGSHAGRTISTLVWATDHSILSLDPGQVYDSGGNNEVTFAECDSLLRFSNSLALSPGLAASWKQTSPTTYVYNLRHNVKFWDGTTMTAQDVAYSLGRILNPKYASPLESLTTAGDVKAVRATGKFQVTMTTFKPNPIARWLPATPVGQVVEKKAAIAAGSSFGTNPKKMMCSGPFRPVSYVKGDQTVLKAVPHYWDTAHQPKIKTLIMKEITDPQTLVAGLRSGNINGTFDLDARDAESLAHSSNLVVDIKPGVQINYISPNLLKGPLQNLDVRKALNMAIDRTGIAVAVDGTAAEPLKGPVTPGISGYLQSTFRAAYQKLPTPLRPSLAQAKALIEKAHAKGETVTIAAEASPTSDTVAAALEQAGASIGLNVKVLKLPTGAYQAENFSGKLPRTYDGLLNFWAPDFADPASELVPPFGSRFSDVEGFVKTPLWPAYAKLESQWRNSPNGSTKQAAILNKMQAYIVNNVVKIPLYVDPLVDVHSASVGGYNQTKLYYYQSVFLSMSGT